MKEQRGSPRHTTLEMAVLVRAVHSDTIVLGGSIRDLSETGARIVGDTRGLRVGQEINVLFLMPLNRRITYPAIVKHIEPDESYGVQFMSG